MDLEISITIQWSFYLPHNRTISSCLTLCQSVIFLPFGTSERSTLNKCVYFVPSWISCSSFILSWVFSSCTLSERSSTDHLFYLCLLSCITFKGPPSCHNTYGCILTSTDSESVSIFSLLLLESLQLVFPYRGFRSFIKFKWIIRIVLFGGIVFLVQVMCIWIASALLLYKRTTTISRWFVDLENFLASSAFCLLK